MDIVDHETLLGWLTRLQLTAIRDQLDSLLDEAAEKKLTLREALAFLVEREVSRKDERRIEMAFKIAHFPAVRELADFDFKAQPSIDDASGPGTGDVAVDRARGRGPPARSARSRENALGDRTRARGDPAALLGAVHHGPGADGGVGQGAQRRPPGWPESWPVLDGRSRPTGDRSGRRTWPFSPPATSRGGGAAAASTEKVAVERGRLDVVIAGRRTASCRCRRRWWECGSRRRPMDLGR